MVTIFDRSFVVQNRQKVCHFISLFDREFFVHFRFFSFAGVLKFDLNDLSKIILRLIDETTPRVAITLHPTLPAYIMFMCIRHTDEKNAENSVRELLTLYLNTVTKFYGTPKPIDYRFLWVANTIRLWNLLKQYGDVEFKSLNTEAQNQQQLKNFDLSEYSRVIQIKVNQHYEATIHQIQETLKHLIVPAILEHDEMARGKRRSRRSFGAQKEIEPKYLVDQLEQIYKQCELFGIEKIFIEQIISQIFHFICAVAMNNLMLRHEMCMWNTGMRIRYNVSCLEDWTRDKKMVSIEL